MTDGQTSTMSQAGPLDTETKRALELIPDGVVIVRRDGVIVYASGQAEQMFGYDLGALEGLALDVLIPPDERADHHDQVDRYWGKPARREMGTPLDLMARKADGTLLPVDIALAPWFGAPEPLVVAAIRDMTQARRLANERMATQQRLQTLAEAADLHLSTGAAPGDVIREAAALLARMMDGACVVTLIDAKHPSSATSAAAHPDPMGEELLRQILAAAPAQVVSAIDEAVLQSDTGSVVGPLPPDEVQEYLGPSWGPFLDVYPISHLIVAPLRVSGTVTGAIAVGSDRVLTDDDRKLVETLAGRVGLAVERAHLRGQVQAASAQLDSMFIDAALGMWVASFDGRLRRVNPAFCAITGRSEADLLGMRFAELSHPDEKETDEETLNLLTSGQLGQITVTKRILRPDRSVVWVRTHVSVRPPDGNSGTLSAQVEDITEAKRATEAARAAERQFAYVASHDLQAPLRTLGGFLDLIREDPDRHLTSEQRQYAEQMHEALDRMRDLTSSLLQYSKIERTGDLQTVGLAEVVAQATSNLEADIDEAGARIDSFVPAKLTVEGDHPQLVQLVQNLLSNSLKYRHPQRPCRITVSAAAAPGLVTLRVADNGIGIDPRQHDRVFEMFQRLHADSRGTGIGLAVVRKIVERHRGTVTIDSDGRTGTTMVVTLRA